jgi:hypothetical protein
LGLASCRSSKVTEPTYTKAPKPQELIDSVEQAHFNFEWVTAKISGKYKGADQSFSFKGNLKIRKDSVIWMSISPGLGLELGRVFMDTDSIHFMNRFDKTYYKSSYEDLSERIQSPLSFKRIQALLIGNSLSDYEAKKYYSELKKEKFILSSVSEKQLKKMERSRRKSNEEIYIAEIIPQDSKIVLQQLINLSQDRVLTVEYEDFEDHNQQQFAESVGLSIQAIKGMNLNLSYSKIQLNKKSKFPFKVPSSYEIIH